MGLSSLRINSGCVAFYPFDEKSSKIEIFDFLSRQGINANSYLLTKNKDLDVLIVQGGMLSEPGKGERWRDPAEREKHRTSPIDRIMDFSPTDMIRILYTLRDDLTRKLSHGYLFPKEYMREVSVEKIDQKIEDLENIRNKYNKILKQTILEDIKQDLEPHVRQVKEWQDILNYYLMRETAYESREEVGKEMGYPEIDTSTEGFEELLDPDTGLPTGKFVHFK